MEELWLNANGIRFHALADGPDDGPLVVLLHGFPELARSWRHQLPALAAAGYRAVAPDMRGYGQTDLQGPYDLATLSADIASLVRVLGHDKGTVVGHDWGGGVAWGTAFIEPQVVERLVIINCPHPAVLSRELLRNPSQLMKSWYMFMFQVPGLAEYLLGRDRASGVVRALKGGSFKRDVWTREELEPYREAFSRPGALAAAIGYYRAAFRNVLGIRKLAFAHRIAAPLLVIWGTHDAFLGKELVAPERLAPFLAPGNAPTYRWVEDSGHFVPNESPEAVNSALVEWLGPPRREAGSSARG